MHRLVSWLCLAIMTTVVLAFSAASRSVSQTSLSEIVLSSDVAKSEGTESDAVESSVIESDSLEADSITLPPTRQTFANGDYQLVIEAANQFPTTDQWQAENAIAKLYKNDTLQWQQPLPHAYGPRFVVLSAYGKTLLLDEFINVASPYAITLLSATGEQIAQYRFEDVADALALPAVAITQQATSGWWISTPPALSARENLVFIQTGGQYLTVELITGELTVSQTIAAGDR